MKRPNEPTPEADETPYPNDAKPNEAGGFDRSPAPNGAPPRRKQAVGTRPRERSPIEMIPDAQPPQPLDDKSDQPSPLEASPRSAFVKVKRITAHGPKSGFEDGDDYEGPLGKVPHTDDLEMEIRRRWGGGDYEITGVVNGHLKTVPLSIGGPSRPDGLEDDDDYWNGPPPTATSGVGYARQSFVAPGATGASYPPGGFTPPGYPPGYFGTPPYGGYPPQFGPGVPPYQNQQAYAYHNMGRAAPADDDEKRGLRQELDDARERERQAKEDARLAEIRRDMDRRDAEHKAEIDRLSRDLRERKSDSGSEVKDMIAQQQAAMNTRIEEERLDRERRRDEEEARRKEERDKLEVERRDERDRRDRAETERATREDREDRRRRDELEREKAERTAEANRQERHLDRMMTMMTSNQVKPSDMIGMMGSLKQLGGGDNVGKQLRDMVETVADLKDLANDGPANDDPAEKAQKFVAGVTTAAQPILSEVTKWMQPQQPPQPQYQQPPPQVLPPGGFVDAQGRVWIPRQPQMAQQPAPQQMPQAPPPQQVPGPPPVQPAPLHNPQGGPPTPAQAGAQIEIDATRRGVTPQQWGKILEFTVDHVLQQTKPEEAAEHLLTTLKAIDARPALEQLASQRLNVLRTNVNLLLIANKVTDANHVARMKKFVEISDARAPGAKWLNEYLAHLRGYWEALRDAHAKQVAAARGAPAPPPVPPIVQPADGPSSPAPPPAAQDEAGNEEGEDDLPDEVPEHGEGS